MLGAPRPVLALAAAGLVGLVVAVSVSHWWKMSIHSAVAAGTVVILVLTFGPRLLVARRCWAWSAGPGSGCGTTPCRRCWPAGRSAP